MPFDSRNDMDNFEDGLPKSPSQAEKEKLPPKEASNQGNPFMESVSIKNFKPDAALQGQIDKALGDWPARPQPAVTAGINGTEAMDGNGQQQ